MDEETLIKALIEEVLSEEKDRRSGEPLHIERKSWAKVGNGPAGDYEIGGTWSVKIGSEKPFMLELTVGAIKDPYTREPLMKSAIRRRLFEGLN